MRQSIMSASCQADTGLSFMSQFKKCFERIKANNKKCQKTVFSHLKVAVLKKGSENFSSLLVRYCL